MGVDYVSGYKLSIAAFRDLPWQFRRARLRLMIAEFKITAGPNDITAAISSRVDPPKHSRHA